jgi:Bacterial Ig-like domain (group 3)
LLSQDGDNPHTVRIVEGLVQIQPLDQGEFMLKRMHLSFIATSLMLVASTGHCQAQQTAQPPVKSEIHEAWRKSMVRKALPKNGCFKAEYPSTEWQEMQCGRPSPHPNFPCVVGGTVGDGCDYVAQASGSNLISSAEGSFLPIPSVTTVGSVSGVVGGGGPAITDVFMLQMNTQSEFNRIFSLNPYPSNFSTPACSGAPNGAAGCYAWQQFLFSQTQGPAPGSGQHSVPGATGTTPGVFIEYWLFNWGTPCPALPAWATGGGATTWTPDGSGDCWFNGPMTYVPPQTAAELPGLVMTSAATATQDTIELSTTSGMYAYAEPNVLSLSLAWTQVEFNVFGDCCLSQTTFTSATVLVPQVSIDDGTTSAPTCVQNDGTTGETNNLILVPTAAPVCCAIGGSSPSIEFMEAFDTSHTHNAWCTPTTLEGDPHITTADGIHYNFQGAGEFISLRDRNGAEIQTRQKPISTTWVGTDSYDGLSTCVSLNTAVAARVGEHRVTWEPNLSGVPDPTGLQLRIDGALTTLGPQGMALGTGGSVSPQAGGALEVDFPDGKTLLVTPQWWASQSEWYLNVDISHLGLESGEGNVDVSNSRRVSGDGAAFGRGIAAAIASGSWLPALPDGASIGPMPSALSARYSALYRKFADAWRVNNKNTLFDYAPGTSTETFTNREWPPEQPPCIVRDTKPLEPGSQALAAAACRYVGGNRHADCVFDVLATGDVTFAKTYLATQRILAYSTTTTLTADADPTQIGEWVTFTASVVPNSSGTTGIPGGTVQFEVDGMNEGEPVNINSKGGATWATSKLKAGTHRITASYLPGAESVFLPSTSLERLHVVRRCPCNEEAKRK